MKALKSIVVPLLLGLLLFTACGGKNDDNPSKEVNNGGTTVSTPEKESGNSGKKDPVPGIDEKDVVLMSMFTINNVNARTEGSLTADVRYVIEKSTEVGLLNKSEEWSKILYDGEISFVATKYLTLVNPEEKPVEGPVEVPVEPTGERKLIVIDAGHQAKGNSKREPNGPGSTQMKAKVSSGTVGVSTGIYEYELNLVVTLKLRDELESRGYEVMLVRSTHNVDISNVERAEFANENKASAFIRIHANGSEDRKVKGMLTICQTANNPYNASLYKESYRLSDEILRGMLDRTGAIDQDIWQTDTMTGINWSKVPSTIVEMGYMSNPEEDVLLNTGSYQDKIVEGIANGLDAYFK